MDDYHLAPTGKRKVAWRIIVLYKNNKPTKLEFFERTYKNGKTKISSNWYIRSTLKRNLTIHTTVDASDIAHLDLCFLQDLSIMLDLLADMYKCHVFQK